ncbi:MAG: hypothetical protein ABGY42_11060 [bacterium]
MRGPPERKLAATGAGLHQAPAAQAKLTDAQAAFLITRKEFTHALAATGADVLP